MTFPTTSSGALTATSPTLLDVAKRTDPNGKIMSVIEALQQRNTLIQTMAWKEGNLDTGHRVAARNALPSVSWVAVNEGVAASKSTVDSYDEQCGILEGLSSVDDKLAELNGNGAALRASEDDAFLAQMSNTLEAAFFYENTAVSPKRILGLTPRLNLSTGKYGNQIIQGSATHTSSVQTSIWLIGWGDRSVYGISPRGQATGLTMRDMGLVRTLDGNGNALYKWETLFRWRCGLCIEDYRNVVRIANVDTTHWTITSTAFDTDIVDVMVQAYYQIFDPKATRLAWYVGRKTGAMLHRQAMARNANSTLAINPAPMIGSPGIFGQPMLTCLGIPIYVSDALNYAEAVVS